jgi:hypothetical protein
LISSPETKRHAPKLAISPLGICGMSDPASPL